jgi:hypothetical protein
LIELYGEPTNYKIALRDKAGWSKGTLLMDFSGNKSLQNIEFDDGNVLQITVNNSEVKGDIECSSSNSVPNDQSKDSKKTYRQKRKPKKRSTLSSTDVCSHSSTNTETLGARLSTCTNQQGRRTQPSYGSDEDIDKDNHFNLLSLVFAEASELFSARRQTLNNLTLQKCQPKERSVTATKSAPVFTTAFLITKARLANLYFQFSLVTKSFPTSLQKFEVHEISSSFPKQD